jgi:hypothetical protein
VGHGFATFEDDERDAMSKNGKTCFVNTGSFIDALPDAVEMEVVVVESRCGGSRDPWMTGTVRGLGVLMTQSWIQLS